ncbi:MAG TPA: FxsA family protein [Pseudorhizobium sp.]|nr:FxsA family protein [Pseudorhizobium sp.]
MRTPWIVIVILLMPLAEIAGFVMVGRSIGVWSTLGLVILTGVAGVLLLRAQGLQVLRQLSAEGREGRMPSDALVHGAMIVVAALLLLIPGFISDIIGLSLFIPAVRRALWAAIGRRVLVQTSYSRSHSYEADFNQRTPAGPVVDLDDDDYWRQPNPSSPWNDPRLKDE